MTPEKQKPTGNPAKPPIERSTAKLIPFPIGRWRKLVLLIRPPAGSADGD